MVLIDNEVQAKEFIANNKYAMIIWHETDCEVCKHFLDTMKDVTKEVPEFAFGLVEGDAYTSPKLFEPDSSPVSFFFKEGIRLMAPPGQAPIDIIMSNLTSVINGTFKTRREIENEQLELLKNYK